MEKDIKFYLPSIVDGSVQNISRYKTYRNVIQDHGFFVAGCAKIYTPELALVLISEEFPAQNTETGAYVNVNGLYYLQTYTEAYNRGRDYFDKEHHVSSNTLYGPNAEQYVKDIHINYFHTVHIGSYEGWCFVKRDYPTNLTHKIIERFGFYSGIVSRVDEMVKKYPKIFKTFDICDHRKPDLEAIESTVEEPEAIEDNHTRNVIIQKFESMDKEGWEYAFQRESDYNVFVDILVNFFESKEYILPEKLIQLKKRSKTKLASRLGRIHKALSPEGVNLIDDNDFFTIVRKLDAFVNYSKDSLYKALTRF